MNDKSDVARADEVKMRNDDLAVRAKDTIENAPEEPPAGISSGDDAEDYLLLWKSDDIARKSRNKTQESDQVVDDVSGENPDDLIAKRGRSLSFKKQLCDRKRNSADEPTESQPEEQGGCNNELAQHATKRRKGTKSFQGSKSTKLQVPHPWTAAEDEKLLAATEKYAGQGARKGMAWVKIRDEFGGMRTATQCFHRFKVLDTKRSKQIVLGHWTDEETSKLVEAVGLFDGQAKGGGISWVKVSAHLDGRRTPNQCCQRWNETIKHASSMSAGSSVVRTGLWTPEEDTRLAAAVHAYQTLHNGRVSWVQISRAMGGERTHNQCFKRWTVVLRHRPNLSNGDDAGTSEGGGVSNKQAGPWQPQEDAQLLEAVELFAGQGHGGSVSWTKVSERLGGTRTSVQCRARFVNSLQKKSPTLLGALPRTRNSEDVPNSVPATAVSTKHGPWTAAEDNRLAESVAMHDTIRGLYSQPGRGSRVSWVRVSEQMDNRRTPTQCRERWNSVLKHKVLREEENDSESTAVALAPLDMQDRPATTTAGCGLLSKPASTTKRTGHWTAEEDEQLLRSVKEFAGRGCGGGIAWTHVSRELNNGRTPNQCFKRWSTALKLKAGSEVIMQVQSCAACSSPLAAEPTGEALDESQLFEETMRQEVHTNPQQHQYVQQQVEVGGSSDILYSLVNSSNTTLI